MSDICICLYSLSYSQERWCVLYFQKNVKQNEQFMKSLLLCLIKWEVAYITFRINSLVKSMKFYSLHKELKNNIGKRWMLLVNLLLKRSSWKSWGGHLIFHFKKTTEYAECNDNEFLWQAWPANIQKIRLCVINRIIPIQKYWTYWIKCNMPLQHAFCKFRWKKLEKHNYCDTRMIKYVYILKVVVC